MTRKLVLTEELERLQEEPIGPYMGYTEPVRFDTSGARTLNPNKFNPRAWQAVDNSETDWPYDEDTRTGPANATGRTGQSGVGRGGVGWGGREDVSGGVREPSARYRSTWEQNEGAEWEEDQRHGDGRNLWRDTDTGKHVKKVIDNEEEGMTESYWTKLSEAMGTPYNFTQAYGHGNNMTAGTNPGVQSGWARSPNLGEEEDEMKLSEFFDPSPVKVEEIDNPGQDNFKDQSDEEIEPEFSGRHADGSDDEEDSDSPEIEIQGTMDADGAEDLASQLRSAAEEPENTSSDFENIMMIPNSGHATEFLMSPTKMGAARGSYGLKSDSIGGGNEIVDKSSAWDILAKVVRALGEDDGNSPISR